MGCLCGSEHVQLNVLLAIRSGNPNYTLSSISYHVYTVPRSNDVIHLPSMTTPRSIMIRIDIAVTNTNVYPAMANVREHIVVNCSASHDVVERNLATIVPSRFTSENAHACRQPLIESMMSVSSISRFVRELYMIFLITG